MKIAYMMSRFPKITETFVLYEMVAVMQLGIAVEIYPLMREHTTTMHPEAVPLVEQAHFTAHISLEIILTNLRALVSQPRTYFLTLFTSLRATLGSRRFFTGILAFYPKSVYLAYKMQAAGITHIHAHFASFPAATAYIIHQFTDIPYSFTAHGSDLHRDQHMLYEKIHDSKFVATISKYNHQILLSYCDESDVEKVRIIHCGVDVDAFKPDNNYGDTNTLNLLCIGTLHEVKGQKYLIQACARLKESGIKFQCHFIGDGPDETVLQEEVAHKNLSDEITFHGRLLRSEVIRILSQADIVITPSVPTNDGRREGIPVVIMEAMAFGIPVIASDLSGIPELIDPNINGILVPPGDVDAIATAIERLISKPNLRRKLGTNGRQKIIDEFNLDENARILSELFEEITP
jgi:colanic acid/amylovoran biosynthesis glycosyltransferase